MLLVASIFLAFIIILMIQEINDKNKNIKIESNPENTAIERMVQESLLNEKQKTQKNKSRLVRHRNNLFDDVHHCYSGNDNKDYYNSGNNYSEKSTDTFADNSIDSLMDPSYSLTPGNFFYNEP